MEIYQAPRASSGEEFAIEIVTVSRSGQGLSEPSEVTSTCITPNLAGTPDSTDNATIRELTKRPLPRVTGFAIRNKSECVGKKRMLVH